MQNLDHVQSLRCRKVFKEISAEFFMARKISGGRCKSLRKKKLSEIAGKPRLTNLGKEKQKVMRGHGGKEKNVLLAAESAFVLDPKTKKIAKSKINSVLRSPANRYFKTQMVKGTIIDTGLGKAKVTNRPGQEGSVSAVLVSE